MKAGGRVPPAFLIDSGEGGELHPAGTPRNAAPTAKLSEYPTKDT